MMDRSKLSLRALDPPHIDQNKGKDNKYKDNHLLYNFPSARSFWMFEKSHIV